MSEEVVIARSHPSPKVSVIIPSLDGYRGGNVPGMMNDLADTGYESLEILIVKGVRPNGRARDEGVKRASGKYYIFLDDDVRIGPKSLVQSLIEPFEKYPNVIGITGASYLLPTDAPAFQKWVARELPRVECPISATMIESDMVCHACLAVPAEVYKKSGGESRVLESGTDPDFKARIRALGYQVVIVPQTWVWMPAFANYGELCRKSFQTGRNSCRMQREHPADIHPSGTRLEESQVKRITRSKRIQSYLKIMGNDLLQGRWLALSNRICYLSGFAVESMTGRRENAGDRSSVNS